MYGIPSRLSINDIPNFGMLLIHMQGYDAYTMYINLYIHYIPIKFTSFFSHCNIEEYLYLFASLGNQKIQEVVTMVLMGGAKL